MNFIWLYILPFVIILIAQGLVKFVYNKYKTIDNEKKLTGFGVARKILDDNGLKDILIVETKGVLSDHYDPKRNVIRLSTNIYHDSSIASIAIAAHECGHAIQYKNKYSFIKIRNFLVPFVNFVSKFGYVVLIIGFLANIFNLALLGIGLLSLTLLFQLITLPVEFDASKRAKKILNNKKMINKKESSKVNVMLNVAAFTYIASLLANLLEIMRLILILNRRD